MLIASDRSWRGGCVFKFQEVQAFSRSMVEPYGTPFGTKCIQCRGISALRRVEKKKFCIPLTSAVFCSDG